VTVREGRVSTQSESQMKHAGQPYTDEEMLWVTDLYPSSDWAVDSDEALTLANDLFREEHGQEPTGAAYVLFNGIEIDMANEKLLNSMRWEISYNPEGPHLQVTIDARSGEVID